MSRCDDTITRLVQDSLLSSRDAHSIARAIGKPYSTLMREVNPYDTGAKLGADTLLQIMLVTGDVQPLEFMAEKLGCKLVKE